MAKKTLKRFVKERDEAMLSLDKEKIISYCKKYEIPIPANEIVFWAGIHKAICHLNAASIQQKLESMEWLYSHGFSADIQ